MGDGLKQKWKLERAEARLMVDAATAKAAELKRAADRVHRR